MSSCLKGFFSAVGIINFNTPGMKDTFNGVFENQVDFNYFKSQAYKDLNYTTYSFLLNATPMFIITACLLGSTFVVLTVGKSIEATGAKTESLRT